jgi:diacylglycerol kinase
VKKQIKSFFYAFRGVGTAIKTEPHLRFHLVAAVFVLIFAVIGGFSADRMAVLLTLIGAVIALEIVNTALERACDAVTDKPNELVKAAKDCAAGAVLVMAIAAAAVAVLFFLNAETIGRVFGFFAAYPLALIPLAALAVASVLFIALGGKRRSNTIL